MGCTFSVLFRLIRALIDTLVCLTRVPNLNVPSVHAAIAKVFDIEYSALLISKGARIETAEKTRLTALEELSGTNLHSHADVLQALEMLAKNLYSELALAQFDAQEIESSCNKTFPSKEIPADLTALLKFLCKELVPNLNKTAYEVSAVLDSLSGRYIPPGPSGAPSRGMAHILPTGRNFYSIDPRNVPSQSAWSVGTNLADQVIERFLAETGEYPESVCISMWGTSAMRTQGDDVAEVLGLLGVRPQWHAVTRKITGLDLIPLDQLKRPRIDVTVRISGLFRDAFPHLISLMDNAFKLTMDADEPVEMNFVRKHYLAEQRPSQNASNSSGDFFDEARFRIFGAKPGSYGAGVLPLIQEQNWSTADDIARAYIEWSAYAYGDKHTGVSAKDSLCRRLQVAQIAIHNQDNREHDIFDSDDYFQFHGGVIAAIRSLSGKEPRKYFGDSQDAQMPVVKDLKSEALKVFRSRVVNPKWIESIKQHGYKGGLELTATIDYLFGYDATAQIMDDWMYEEAAQTYALDAEMKEFLRESNPWALQDISERLLEAAERKMWKQPDPATLAALQKTFLDTELALENKTRPQTSARTDNVSV